MTNRKTFNNKTKLL